MEEGAASLCYFTLSANLGPRNFRRLIDDRQPSEAFNILF